MAAKRVACLANYLASKTQTVYLMELKRADWLENCLAARTGECLESCLASKIQMVC